VCQCVRQHVQDPNARGGRCTSTARLRHRTYAVPHVHERVHRVCIACLSLAAPALASTQLICSCVQRCCCHLFVTVFHEGHGPSTGDDAGL
jgi:hypothetical protein